MPMFMIHVPADAKTQHELTARQAEQVTAVKQGFHWLAFFFSLIWLLVNRLWLWAFAFFAASLAVMFAGDALGAAPFYVSCALMLLSAFIGFEAAHLRSEALKKRGLVQADAILAKTEDEANLRFFEKRNGHAL